MSTLHEKAQEIRAKREAEKNQRIENAKKGQFEARMLLRKEFEIGFKDIIPLLEDAGISWDAFYQDPIYQFNGYILFQYKGRRLKMDFSNRTSYRYEFVSEYKQRNGHSGTMVYGAWDKDRFITWIDEKLIRYE